MYRIDSPKEPKGMNDRSLPRLQPNVPAKPLWNMV